MNHVWLRCPCHYHWSPCAFWWLWSPVPLLILALSCSFAEAYGCYQLLALWKQPCRSTACGWSWHKLQSLTKVKILCSRRHKAFAQTEVHNIQPTIVLTIVDKPLPILRSNTCSYTQIRDSEPLLGLSDSTYILCLVFPLRLLTYGARCCYIWGYIPPTTSPRAFGHRSWDYFQKT